MQHCPTIGGNSSVQGGKLKEVEDFKCIFVVYCVRALVRELLSNNSLFVG